MLIVLEGSDCAGKSTLARDVREQFIKKTSGTLPIDVLHARPPTKHPLDEYELPLLHHRPGASNIICDRWHLGEPVYSRVLDRPTRWDTAVERHIYMFMKSRGAYVVLLSPEIDELKTRYRVRGDYLINLKDLVSIRCGYLDLRQHINVVFDNLISPPSPRDIVFKAMRAATNAEELNAFTTYVGPPRPSALLFGDVRAGRVHAPTPAFMPYLATSGHYLLTHLDVIGAQAGLANACDVDDPLLLWNATGQPPVVALGRKASTKLTAVGVPHGTVPHPQYVRRFHHAHGKEYATVITDAWWTGKDMSSWRP